MKKQKKGQIVLSTKLLLGIIAVLMAVIVVLLVLLLCKPAIKAEEVTVPSTGESQPVVQALDPEDPGMQQATEETGVPVVTKYMRFTYPEDLKEILIVREDETEDRFQVTFSMIAAEQEVELFAIILSQAPEEGYKLGTLEDETYGTVIVTTRINEQKSTDWPEDVFGQINAMQERINDILVQFYEDPRFTPGN